jgi:hypothetical protein
MLRVTLRLTRACVMDVLLTFEHPIRYQSQHANEKYVQGLSYSEYIWIAAPVTRGTSDVDRGFPELGADSHICAAEKVIFHGQQIAIKDHAATRQRPRAVVARLRTQQSHGIHSSLLRPSHKHPKEESIVHRRSARP